VVFSRIAVPYVWGHFEKPEKRNVHRLKPLPQYIWDGTADVRDVVNCSRLCRPVIRYSYL
jgi:hypothetical protein